MKARKRRNEETWSIRDPSWQSQNSFWSLKFLPWPTIEVRPKSKIHPASDLLQVNSGIIYYSQISTDQTFFHMSQALSCEGLEKCGFKFLHPMFAAPPICWVQMECCHSKNCWRGFCHDKTIEIQAKKCQIMKLLSCFSLLAQSWPYQSSDHYKRMWLVNFVVSSIQCTMCGVYYGIYYIIMTIWH
jgi:hypothetical protein